MGDLNAILNDKYGHQVNENEKIINDFIEYSPEALIIPNSAPTFERPRLGSNYLEALDHAIFSSDIQIQGNESTVLGDSILLSYNKPLFLV